MIVFLESGRLGNQLFQYAALRSIATNESLVLLGFDDLRCAFEGLEASFPLRSDSKTFRACQRVNSIVGDLLIRSHLFGLIRENPTTSAPFVTEGTVNRLKFAPTAYFQSENAFDPAVMSPLRIKPNLALAASQFIDEVRAAGNRPVFVHIRRGDYLHFPCTEFPAVLPEEWYRQRIAQIRSEWPDAYFVFFSDDLQYARDVFGDVSDGCAHDADPATTFAIMCACDGGILSASSFAWWAAYFASREGATGRFLAPRYWVGHRRQHWHPPSIQSSFLTYA